MSNFCRVCGGVGTVNQPMSPGTTMSYCGPNGESWPQIICPNCSGVKIAIETKNDYLSDDYLTRREKHRTKMMETMKEFIEDNDKLLSDLAKSEHEDHL